MTDADKKRQYKENLEAQVEDAQNANQFVQSRAGMFFQDYRTKRINKLMKELREHPCTDGVCMGIKREINAIMDWDKHLNVTKKKGQVAAGKLDELRAGEPEATTPESEEVSAP